MSDQNAGRLAGLSSRTFTSNVIWNVGSLGILAAAGLVINFVIARSYGAAALGLFNIILAIYIFLSQVAVFGVHFSILRDVSEFSDIDRGRTRAAISGALLAVCILSSVVTLVAFVFTPVIEIAYSAEGLRIGWWSVLPGLVFFALNKVLLSAINGAQHMRAFALLQVARYGLMVLVLGCMIAGGVGKEWLPVIVSLAEIVLFFMLIAYVRTMIGSFDWRGGRGYVRAHLSFGLRVFPSGVISELNTRVDVLMMGAILDERQVGIYTIALLVAEGFAQIIVVVRNNLNPLMTQLYLGRKVQDLEKFAVRVSGVTLSFMVIGAILLSGIFWLLVPVIFPNGNFDAAVLPLVILLAGIAVSSSYLVFGMIFTQVGLPVTQTVFSGCTLLANITLNLAFIPAFGLVGAAIATGATYVISALILLGMMKKYLALRVWI